VWRRLLVMMASLLCAVCTQASADGASASDTGTPRMALVIGNATYPDQPLASAASDARAMTTALGRRGYTVIHHEDLSADGLRQALQLWRSKRAAEGGNVLYFAGHGIQAGDSVRLLGVDARPGQPATLMTRAVDLAQVLAHAAPADGGLADIIVLDTCLDNPFGAAVASTPPPPAGVLLAYATRPGGFAADRDGHGIWTHALLQAMAEESAADLATTLDDAVLRVLASSAGAQRPWVDKGMAPGPPAGIIAASAQGQRRGVLPKDSAEQVELTFWDSVKDSAHASDYEAYLQAYPNGRFAALARARIERLKAAAPKAEAPKPAPAPVPEKPRPPVAKRPADGPPATAPAEPARAAGGASLLQKAGSDIRDCPACPVLAVIAPGAFTMGSNTSDPSEKPPRRVTVDAPFAIGRTEVTVEQWSACVDAGACPRTADAVRAPNTPVRDISWNDAQLYLKWLSGVSGKSYRLPTEAEWEYAARGGTSTRYAWGDEMRRGSANCKDCGEPWQADGPSPVASFAPNAYGLHDMNGSVWEWVEDCWHSTYKNAPADARAWTESFCPVRVIRGGSWRDGASYMPTTTRFKYDGSVRHSQNGFRVARDVK
jgi:formylglycine-generating enzyme required for sulfatase activity